MPLATFYILRLHKAGLKTREIVANVGMSERSVKKWVKRFDGDVKLASTKL